MKRKRKGKKERMNERKGKAREEQGKKERKKNNAKNTEREEDNMARKHWKNKVFLMCFFILGVLGKQQQEQQQ